MKNKAAKPQRRCVACREMKIKSALMRVAANANGEVSVDISGRAPGRGAYICRNQDCLKKAHKTKGLERSLKRGIPSEIYEHFKEALNAKGSCP